MKLKTQAPGPFRELADCIEGQRVAMLTLPDPSHRLVGRPVTPQEMDEQGALWMMLARCPAAERLGATGATVSLAFTDERRGTYVSITGHARVVHDLERKRELWSAITRPGFAGEPEDPQLLLLKLRPEHADICEGPSSRGVRVLALSAAIAP